MFGLLALLFLVVPIVELYVIVQVAQGFGVLPTIVLVMVVSAVGAWLCKREGLGLIRRVQREVEAGRVPTSALIDGFLVLFAGALLLTPGFVTDLLGLALLLPPVRLAVRAVLVRRFAAKARRMAAQGMAGGFTSTRTRLFVFDGNAEPGRDRPGRRDGRGRGPVIDVDASYERPGNDDVPPELRP
ncbi:MAG: FxsA family protein [Acidimicrobiales bacterium]|nr:FxsA family protein [Acidimicrobiales bacterium]